MGALPVRSYLQEAIKVHVCVCMCVSVCSRCCSMTVGWFVAETEHAGFYNQGSRITFSPSHQSDLSQSSETG